VSIVRLLQHETKLAVKSSEGLKLFIADMELLLGLVELSTKYLALHM
jgi:hypothetical protein